MSGEQRMVKFKINGREAEFEEGTSLLEAAKALEIEIPTLCFNEAVSAYGACRLCVVEVTAGGRKRLTASCTYPVEEGIEVQTDTEELREARRLLVELILAKSPNADYIRSLAASFGVEVPGRFSFREAEQSDCIMCGLCARVCAEVVGVAAIDFSERGVSSKVVPFFSRRSDVCIGCATCVTVCPTDYLRVEDLHAREVAHVWDREDDERRCLICSGWHTVPHFHEDPASLLGLKEPNGSVSQPAGGSP
jgi:NADH dehydrogenase/NADH:ubiquinone oxidoreductase subunit G